MRLLKRLFARLRNLASRQSDDQRLLEEMEEHLSRQAEENLRSGMAPAEARRRAVLKFGAVEAIREQYHAEKSLPFVESIVQDVRYSLRILRKSWGFTSIAAISLALAVGANTTIFSVMKRLLLDRLEVPHAEQLRLLHWHGDKHTAVSNMWGITDNVAEGIAATAFSYPAFEQLRRENHVLEELFAFKNVGTMNATIDSSAQILQGELVSGNFFDQLQVQPQLGRPILPDDDRIGAPTVALISAEVWQRAFGSSPAVVGRTITVNMAPVTIIGVAPSGFTGAESVQSSPDLFLPLSSQPLVEPRGRNGSLLGASSPQIWWLNIMGRARDGVADSSAQAALDTSLSAVVRSTLRLDANTTIPRLDVLDGSRGLFRSKQMFAKPVEVLMAVVGLVLLLACSNIASLLFARSMARQREVALRLALGAGRARVLRGVLTESLLLSALGGTLGVALAFVGCRTLPALLANPWEASQFRMPLDWTVLAFTASVTLLSGLLFGTVPHGSQLGVMAELA